jgi:HPt (histidine-containing phosphotransfer) domain-containing protein
MQEIPGMSIDSISPAAVLDIDGTLARFGGDKELFLELTTMLLEDAPQLFADLRAAVLSNDGATAESKAHALKGLLLNCGGMRASQAAQVVEDAAHTRQLDNNSADDVEALATELSVLTEAIRDYRR